MISRGKKDSSNSKWKQREIFAEIPRGVRNPAAWGRVSAELRPHYRETVLEFQSKRVPRITSFRITNAIRGCTVKSARNAPTRRRTRYITLGEIKEILSWKCEHHLAVANEFSKAISAYLIYVRLLADRESLYRLSRGRKMIKISTCPENLSSFGVRSEHHRNALHTLIAPSGVS